MSPLKVLVPLRMGEAADEHQMGALSHWTLDAWGDFEEGEKNVINKESRASVSLTPSPPPSFLPCQLPSFSLSDLLSFPPSFPSPFPSLPPQENIPVTRNSVQRKTAF